jgi:hypothetical protein
MHPRLLTVSFSPVAWYSSHFPASPSFPLLWSHWPPSGVGRRSVGRVPPRRGRELLYLPCFPRSLNVSSILMMGCLLMLPSRSDIISSRRPRRVRQLNARPRLQGNCPYHNSHHQLTAHLDGLITRLALSSGAVFCHPPCSPVLSCRQGSPCTWPISVECSSTTVKIFFPLARLLSSAFKLNPNPLPFSFPSFLHIRFSTITLVPVFSVISCGIVLIDAQSRNQPKGTPC